MDRIVTVPLNGATIRANAFRSVDLRMFASAPRWSLSDFHVRLVDAACPFR